MNLNILYEDEYILAIDKPCGLMIHTDGRSKDKTLVDWLIQNRPSILEVGEEQILQNGDKIKRPGIVHRLDRDTSGVIVITKTNESFEFLKKQFQNRKVEKVYNCFVWGNFSDEKMEGVIDKPIGRSASDFRKWSAEYGARGEIREAITEYKVLAQRSFSEVGLAQSNNPTNPPYIPTSQSYAGQVKGVKEEKNFQLFSYLEVKPKTGRTHQIRVHLKSIGHPVVGDRLYGGKNYELGIMNYDIEEQGLKNLNRLMLHSASIKLELPNHTHIQIESPLPKEFEELKSLLKTV